MKNLKNYEPIQMQIVILGQEDVVRTSGLFTPPSGDPTYDDPYQP